MPIEQALVAVLSDRSRFGQVLIQQTNAGAFVLCHRDDEHAGALKVLRGADEAIEIAKFDDAAHYRPLKTAPNLRHGWRLELSDLSELRRALDYLYPGRLEVFAAWAEDRLHATPLRETLDRQSGMYRVAAKISDEEVDRVVAKVCRSDGGCLRTILWKRDKAGETPSSQLPQEKFDSTHDQTGRGETTIPLLCQEICSVLLNDCLAAVKNETNE